MSHWSTPDGCSKWRTSTIRLADIGVGRKVDVDDLVGAAEIADRLDIAHRETIHVWRRRYPDFPAPIAELRGVLIWSWPDLERWAKATGRLPRP